MENRIQRAVALTDRTELGVEELMSQLAGGKHEPILPAAAASHLPEEGFDLATHLEAVEKQYLQQALEQTGGHATNAAALLGMTFRAFRYKLKKYGLRRDGDTL